MLLQKYYKFYVTLLQIMLSQKYILLQKLNAHINNK